VTRLLALTAAALVGLFPLAARAQAGQNPGETHPAWITDAKSKCKVWDPDPEPNETVAWSGTCKPGWPTSMNAATQTIWPPCATC
jgi:hypothetical protein